MCMATKAEVSDEINKTLGTNIDWSRLYEDDLKLLRNLVEDGSLIEPMMKQMVKKHGKTALESQIDNWRPGMFVGKLMQE